MFRKIAIRMMAAALVLAAGTAQAALVHLTANIDGLQETPPVATPASGQGTMTFDTDTRLLTWEISFQNLIAGLTNAHFHGPAAVGVGPAGVKLGIPLQGQTGSLSGLFTGSGTVPVADVSDLLGGLWYINIHSTFRTGGEIRGQVLVTNIPLPPAAWAGLGMMGVLAARRARKGATV